LGVNVLNNVVLRWCVLCLFLGLLSGNSSAAERVRKALIVGNAEYSGIPKLKNSVNDAVLIDETLRARGFETTLLTNATKRQMTEAAQEFAKGLDSNSVGLFYFAGHGLEVNGRNYLVPVDASIESEADIEFESVDAGRILSIFKIANNGLNLMILDACRNNPFIEGDSRSVLLKSGLAAMRPATGSLVLYATEPGNVASDNVHGKNGLFTKSLVESIKQPGLKIEDVFKRTAINVRKESANTQTPYIEGVILGDFVFTAGGGLPVESDLSSVTVTTNPVGAKVVLGGVGAWNSPTQINGLTRGDYVNLSVTHPGYVTQIQRIYLNSPNKKIHIRLNAIAANNESASDEQSTRKEALYPFTIQTKPVNARIRILNIGPVYQSGMRLPAGWFQVEVSAEGYRKVTKYVQHRQGKKIARIVLEKKQAKARNPVVEVNPVDNSQELSVTREQPEELVVWNEAKKLNSVEGYRRYLRVFPQGTFSMVALMKLEKMTD